MSRKNRYSPPPHQSEAWPNATEYPASAHAAPTKPSAEKLIINVLSVFFARTSPP